MSLAALALAALVSVTTRTDALFRAVEAVAQDFVFVVRRLDYGAHLTELLFLSAVARRSSSPGSSSQGTVKQVGRAAPVKFEFEMCIIP